jgi:excisionase family DNA binding protein
MSTAEPSWEARNLLNRDKPLTTGELAALFNVNPKTVTRWATSKGLAHFTTLGGHRRYHVEDVARYFAKVKNTRGAL